MRIGQVLIALVVLGVLAAMFAWTLRGRSPTKRGPEVLFVRTTNSVTGQTIGIFRIVNHGPGEIVLWQPAVVDLEGSTNSVVPLSFTGTHLQRDAATTAEVPLEKPSARWRAGFHYDLGGWGGKLERWVAESRGSAPMQKWAWSKWVEP